MCTLRARALVRLLLVLVFAIAPVMVGGHDAGASVSIAITYDALVARSSAVAVVVPAEQRAVWENGRIYTYTRVGVERAVAGGLGRGSEVWVRTMGGIVGKVGQSVEGEAVFTVGRPALIFLAAGPASTYEVTARGQGQFPVVLDAAKTLRVKKSSGAGALVPPQGEAASHRLAADVLHGRSLEDAAQDISTAWASAHAR